MAFMRRISEIWTDNVIGSSVDTVDDNGQRRNCETDTLKRNEKEKESRLIPLLFL